MWMAAIAILLCAATVQGQVLSDSKILSAVEEELATDPVVNPNRIRVALDQGIVTLTGSVPSLLDKERAGRLAEATLGVGAVVNQLGVRPRTAISDPQLKADVKDALLVNPATELLDVDLTVNRGSVRLTGKVESFAEKELAAKVVKNVRGVRSIENGLAVSYSSTRSDSEISHDVSQLLRWDALVDGADVEIEVVDGKVNLSGRVASVAEKKRAVFNARVAGASEVDSERLRVEESLVTEAGSSGEKQEVADDELRIGIENALRFAPRVDSEAVTVVVDDGLVVLSGQVNNIPSYREAEYVARAQYGVKRVRNHLKIVPAKRSNDEKLASDVRQTLQRNPYAERYQLSVTADDGIIRLSGVVDAEYEKVQARIAAESVKGVEKVVSYIRIQDLMEPYLYSPYVDTDYVSEMEYYRERPGKSLKSDGEMTLDIRDQLFWSPYVDADQVSVAVEDGVATLTGSVDSYIEMNAAVENATDGGALWVRNRLEIE